MRILFIILISTIVGTALGATVAYIEVGSDDNLVTIPAAQTASQPKIDASAPRVQVDEPMFNFGTMQRGTKKSHEFVFKNIGAAPLTLRIGTTSCKCTLGEVADDPIPPGGSANVKLEWDAKSDRGPFRQTATILTNDPLQSQVQLTVDGTITDASGVYPPDLVFDKVSAGETKSADVFVMAMLQDEIEVSKAELSDPATRDFFDVKIERVARDELPDPAARDGVRITVTAKPGLPIGRFHQYLTLETNLPDAEKLDIPVVGRVVGDISVHGNGWNEEQGALSLGSVKSSEGGSGKLNIVVRGEGAADVKFDVVSRDPPELKVTIGESRQLKATLAHVPVTIEVPPGTRPMVHLDTAQGEAGRVTLSTTHPKIKELVIGVKFAVQR